MTKEERAQLDELRAGIYRHHKSGYYQVLGVAEHTETGESMVIYVALDAEREGPRMRARPAFGPEGFFSKTPKNTDRFVFLGFERPDL